jgi:preprotein translocase subunit SecG
MFTVILILSLVVCVVLALVVLIQNPKGGGLSGTFGGTANQLFGYKRTSDDIEKITWGLGIALMVLALSAAAFKPGTTADNSVIPFADQADQPDNVPIPNLGSGTDDLGGGEGQENNGGAEEGSDEPLPGTE